jgi:PAS domain S-box-containing protein
MSDADNGNHLVRRNGWLLFVVITGVILAAGYGYFHFETARIRQERFADLSAIATLKSSQIEQWRKERMGDATRSATSPFFQQALKIWLDDRQNPELHALWKKRLKRERESFDYADVMVFDLDGNLLLSAKDTRDPLNPVTRQAIKAALAGEQAVFSELYECLNNCIHMDVAVPVSGADGLPMAVLVMRINAETYLYPLIQTWPTVSPSAETIIVRRDGDAVLFLNHLRHQPDTGLRLRIPLTQTRIPAVQAVMGKKGIFEGVDYRGVKVLADLRPVPGFPWLMVTKVDDSEIMAEARYRTGIAAFFVLVLILLAASVGAFFYRQRQTRVYRALYRSEQRQGKAMKELHAALMEEQQKLRQSEANLLASEQKFRLIFENAPLGILHFDKNGVITACNDNFVHIIGSSKSALIGLDMVKLPDTRIVGILQDALQGRTASFVGDYRSVTADKLTPVRVLFSPIVSESGTVEGGIGIVEDITPQRQAEAEREKLEAQFRQAQKMESVGRLAGGIAHDFNNKLSIINGYAEMALMKLSPSDPLQANIQEIMNAGRRSADLVRQLLAFARKQTIAPICLNLNDTVAPMLTMLQSLIGEDIDLLWQPASDLWTVKVDPAQIDQVLANLAVNARDAIAGVGKVTIETGNMVFDAAYCSRHKGFVEGQFAMLAVSDDGCGMDKQTIDLLFEPFFTTKGVGKGTGLGLSTVYGIVKQNKGFINVYSEPGKGSTFRIYLPREISPDVISEERLLQPDQVPEGDETVLVVEDETMVLEIAKTILEQLGYTVLTAAAPSEALNLAEKYEGEIHLLMTDVVMPEMSGRDLWRQVIRLRPNISTLFMSGYTANAIAHHGVLDKGICFIQKPFSRQLLAVKIREALSVS